MKRYFAELHQKPDHHKKRFALLASGSVTLFIFGVWSLATFGMSGGEIIGSSHSPTPPVTVENEVSPFQSLRMSLASAMEALQGSFQELKSGLEAVDFEAEYTEMRDSTLNLYGQ